MKPLHLVCAYVVLLHLGPLLNLFGLVPGARVFPITTLAHLLMVYLTGLYFLSIRRVGMSRLDWAVTAFVAWSLASFVLYFQKDNPAQLMAYAYGVHLYLMPTFGYYGIKMLSVRSQNKAIGFILWTNIFMLVMGLYLWWARPTFYTDFLRDVVFTNLEDWTDSLMYLRLQSYTASTVIGIICAISVALVGAIQWGPIKTAIALAATLPCAVLCYQRGGQAGTVLGLLYLAFLAKGSRAMRPLILGFSLLAAAGAFAFVMQSSEVDVQYYLDRREDYLGGRLFEGRRGYTVGIDYITAFPLGVGLGGSGNAAVGAGLTQWDKVVDGNFMRVFADLGVEGILMFLLVIGMSVYSAIRVRKNWGIATAILIFSGIALGQTVFDGHLTPQLFWLVLGMADTPAESEVVQKETELEEPIPSHV